ncbi:MAG TPA: arylsulfotransferase family protein [Gemmatimonadales bacterium]|nr:arylsulfotransferase family protein [Gemmatimonadales bacterium]
MLRYAVVERNPDNVLSAIIRVEATGTDSLLVRFGTDPVALDSTTPAFVPRDEPTTVPVLGLLPATKYWFQVVSHRKCGDETGVVLSLTTGPLPDDLPTYTAGGSNPSSGYVVMAAAPFGLVIDNTGRVVWYHRFPGGPGLNFQAQPTGHYVANPPVSSPSAGSWVELDVLGRTIRLITCARGLTPRFHDLLVEEDGSYWVMCDESRIMDLSNVGGSLGARVTGTVVQHIGAGGGLLFEWSAFDHFEITDLEPPARLGNTVNWTHGNAIDREGAAFLLVSFRSLSEITKIDIRTGAVVWRMGGRRNQFVPINGSQPSFVWQHGMRSAGPGGLVLLDNLGDQVGSEVEQYRYDESQQTLTLDKAFGLGSAVVAQLGGTAQQLPGGRILASYGNGGRVEEYGPDGQVQWRIYGDPGYVFRAQRILSLYSPGVGLPR